MTVLERDRLDLLTRRCSTCGSTKTWCEFPIRARWDDGTVRTVLSTCQSCKAAMQRDWRHRNRERVNALKSAAARRRRAEVRKQTDTMLPVEPLTEFLVKDSREPGLLAAVAGLSERTIYRLVYAKQEHVHLSMADQIITRLGGTFELVYPFEGDA